MKLIVSINTCIAQQSGKAAEAEIAWETLLMSFMQTAPQRKTAIADPVLQVWEKEVYYVACRLQSLKIFRFYFFSEEEMVHCSI